jgi:3-hydroxybutyryl-CoA dehydrogenase
MTWPVSAPKTASGAANCGSTVHAQKDVATRAKTDFTGIEVQRRALANGTYAMPPTKLHSEALDRLMAAGRTGVMAGRGFFDWGDREPAELFRERDRRLLALKRALRDIGPLRGQ